jgi:hypothetical protein
LGEKKIAYGILEKVLVLTYAVGQPDTTSQLCINFFTHMKELQNKENIREEFR